MILAVIDATERGQQGDLAAGYDCLLQGLRHARRLRQDGADFGRDLVDRYRQAIDEYSAAYGPRWD